MHICPILQDLYHRVPISNDENVQDERQKRKLETFATESIYQMLRRMALQPSEMLTSFQWQYKEELTRSEFFVPILTENGLCFTFNALNSHEIYTEE